MILTFTLLRDLVLALIRHPLLTVLTVPVCLAVFGLHFLLPTQYLFGPPRWIMTAFYALANIILAIAWHRQISHGPDPLRLAVLFRRPPLWSYLLHCLKIIIPVFVVLIAGPLLLTWARPFFPYVFFFRTGEAIAILTVFFTSLVLGFGFVAASTGQALEFVKGLKAGARYAVPFLVTTLLIQGLAAYVNWQVINSLGSQFTMGSQSTAPALVLAVRTLTTSLGSVLYAILLALAYVHWLEKEEPRRLAGVFE